MDITRLDQIAEEVINDYFENIDSIIKDIVYRQIEKYNITDEYDVKYLTNKIYRGILKLD